MIITRSVQKWGNGKGVRLPQAVLQAAHIDVDQLLQVTLDGKSIVLTPIDELAEVTLDTILVGVTPEKIGSELDWGEEVGLERHE
ncbi:MAG TPA: PbsX family transcriptional regulator [Patescibacteria group bacterium]|nr:PbsX family transcriptional regulator [Patescibacteria group bacterium]